MDLYSTAGYAAAIKGFITQLEENKNDIKVINSVVPQVCDIINNPETHAFVTPELVAWITDEAKTKNNSFAQLGLGLLYAKGIHVAEAIDLAMSWNKKSADQGNSSAMANLGYLYENVYNDKKEAVKFYRMSAEKHNSIGITCLGHCYETGIGVGRDPMEALRLYGVAIDAGDKDALIAHKGLFNELLRSNDEFFSDVQRKFLNYERCEKLEKENEALKKKLKALEDMFESVEQANELVTL